MQPTNFEIATFLRTVLVSIALFAFHVKGYTQCQVPPVACSTEADGFNLLKTYLLDGSDDFTKSVEYSFVLYKNREYLIKICGEAKVLRDASMTLMDKDHNEIMEADLSDSKAVRFTCSASSIYYIRFEMGRKNKLCANATLAFRRRVNEASSSN